jgi:hypothetical protein
MSLTVTKPKMQANVGHAELEMTPGSRVWCQSCHKVFTLEYRPENYLVGQIYLYNSNALYLKKK